MADAVRLYVQGLASYRSLSRLLEQRLGSPVARSTLNTWVDQTGEQAMTPLELSVALAPRWGGFLGVDGKAVFVKGKEHALMVAVDQTTQDVVHALLAPGETEAAFYQLVREVVVVAGYPLRGLVIDAAPRFVAVHANYLARLPLQLCRIHFSRNLDYNIAKNKGLPDAELRAEFKERLRAVLFADSHEEARNLFSEIEKQADRYQGLSRADTIGVLRRHFDLYLTHRRVPGLPPDANITENVIKQLGKKLGLMEGFQSLQSAERFIRLLVGCYRFKRFTDSGNGHNGKSPLELGQVQVQGIDWLAHLRGPR